MRSPRAIPSTSRCSRASMSDSSRSNGGSPVEIGLLPSSQAVQRAIDGGLDHALVEDVGQRLKHGLVKKVLSDLETVRADGVPSLVVVGAAVEVLPAVAMGPGHRN
jgi:hypothetical protein